MEVDLKAVGKRIESLENMYCKLAKTQEKDGTWDYWLSAEIDALKQELAVAQRKKIAEQGDLNKNVIYPIISSWAIKEQPE